MPHILQSGIFSSSVIQATQRGDTITILGLLPWMTENYASRNSSSKYTVSIMHLKMLSNGYLACTT